MLQAAEAPAGQLGPPGQGQRSRPAPLIEQVEAGACGLKDHEDWGTTPAAIDCCLRVADEYDVQVAIHTDTLNESGFVEDTIAAIAGRTIHTYHTEGAGGGHAPDIIRIAGEPNVAALVHQPDPALHRQHARRAPGHADGLPPPQPGRARGRRLRREPHPGRDDRRRGRPARPRACSACTPPTRRRWAASARASPRLFQTADKMKRQRGPAGGGRRSGNDNLRILRYLAKLTINPAITHGIAHEVGSLETGQAGRHRALAASPSSAPSRR